MGVMKVCKLVGCERPVKSRGYCNRHYLCDVRHGSPTAKTRMGPDETKAFIALAVEYEGNDCLYWPRKTKGRPQVRFDGRARLVARYVCELRHGKPPFEGADAAHSCGNGEIGCVAGSHVRWATRLENCEDTILHGRTTRGERNHHAKLSEPEAREVIKAKGTLAEIAQRFQCSPSNVSAIKRRRSWSWLSEEAV